MKPRQKNTESRSRFRKKKHTNVLTATSAAMDIPMAEAMDIHIPEAAAMDIHMAEYAATPNHKQTKKRNRSALYNSPTRRILRRSKSNSSSPLRKRLRTQSRDRTPIIEHVPYIVYHENKIDDPFSVSDSYRPIIIIYIPLFNREANTAFYKTSGRSNDQFKGLYTDTWVPTAGLIENSGYIKKNGEVLTFGFIIKMSTISNITEKKTYKWIYELIIDYFDSITPDIYKPTLEKMKPTQSSINSYYESVRQYLINTTEDDLKFFESLFNEYKDIHQLLHNYFLYKEQIFISAQLGGGYWEKNTRFCNYICNHINGSGVPREIVSIVENAKSTVSTIVVPFEGAAGNNTQDVVDFLKVNNAEYSTDEIKENVESIEMVPYSFYIISLYSILSQVNNTRKVLARFKK